MLRSRNQFEERLLALMETGNHERAEALLRQRVERRQAFKERHVCYHCRRRDGLELFMVHDEVWRSVLPADWEDPKQGFLHMTCLEERLGRKLVRSDFTDVPANAKIFLRNGWYVPNG